MKFFAKTFERAVALCVVALIAVPAALAAPGAHGPNGEHLDAPAAQGSLADASPRMEAKSDQFELVATLAGGELSMLIDRFQTNEPVLQAKVEVESGKAKAVAKFHADHGDYAVDDPALLKALSAPGAHPLVITVIAGKESDLLEGTLNVTQAGLAAAQEHGHAHGDEHGAAPHDHAGGGWLRPALVVVVLALLGVAGLWWRRRSQRAPREEVLS